MVACEHHAGKEHTAAASLLIPVHTIELLLILVCACAEKVNAEIVECACIIELPDLKGREKLGDNKLFVLVEKEGL